MFTGMLTLSALVRLSLQSSQPYLELPEGDADLLGGPRGHQQVLLFTGVDAGAGAGPTLMNGHHSCTLSTTTTATNN